VATTSEAPASIRELESTLDAIVEEYEGLLSEQAKNKRRLFEVNKELERVRMRRKEIGLAVVRGDEEAIKEAADLKASAADAQEQAELLEGALEQLGRLIDEASLRRDEAQDKLARARANEIRTEMRAVEECRDSLAEELVEVLKEHGALMTDYANALRAYSASDANRLASRRVIIYDSWVRKWFGKWLG